MGIEVDDEGDLARLEELEQRLEDMTPATRAIAQDLKAFVAERFRTRTAPDGTPWAPLKGPSKSRGVMERSVFANARADGVDYGAGAEWADDQQNGTPRMVARPFVPTAQHTSGPALELRARIEQRLREHVLADEEAVDDLGFGSFNF